mgnify:CR=1 FL=1
MQLRLPHMLFLLLLSMAVSCSRKSQDPMRKLKKKSTASKVEDLKSSLAFRKQEKKKWKEQREEQIFTKKAVKEHHKRLQSKFALKNMRENKKKSDRLRRYGY